MVEALEIPPDLQELNQLLQEFVDFFATAYEAQQRVRTLTAEVEQLRAAAASSKLPPRSCDDDNNSDGDDDVTEASAAKGSGALHGHAPPGQSDAEITSSDQAGHDGVLRLLAALRRITIEECRSRHASQEHPLLEVLQREESAVTMSGGAVGVVSRQDGGSVEERCTDAAMEGAAVYACMSRVWRDATRVMCASSATSLTPNGAGESRST